MGKRVLLSFAFLLSIVQGSEAWDGSGTAESPYILANTADWAAFATKVNDGTYADKHFKLSNTWDNSAAAVTATVGTEQNPFQGTFDGNGKTLRVNINETTTQGTAPFRNVMGATVKDLTVEGSVTGTFHAAGLVGFVRAGGTTTISGCIVKTIVNNYSGYGKGYIGGVVGHGTMATIAIKNTIFAGDLNSTSDYAGGLQGWSDGNKLTITNSFFLGIHTGRALFHPIALQYNDKTTRYTNNGAYYISTEPPTVVDNRYIAATGKPVYTEPIWDIYSKITAPDGQEFYVEAIFYNQRSWDAENKQVVTALTPCTSFTVLEGEHSNEWLDLGSADYEDDYYYVVKGNVKYKTLNIFGNVHLILADEATLNCNGGIRVEKQNNATLSIYSQSDDDNCQGKILLENTSYWCSACLGSSEEKEPGKIICHGGRFEYINSGPVACIGGGRCASGGELTFYGGYYKLEASSRAAVIGSGLGGEEPINGGIIKIYGGTFDLKGADDAAVIGGGCRANSGTIDIYGGDITVVAEYGGSGIGHGTECTTTDEGHINIHGGKVTAKGDGLMKGATLIGFSVGVAKYGGAAIGGSDGVAGGNITISGGEVEATSGYFASAIGGGYGGSGGNITISGGTVKALQQREKLDDIASAVTDQGAGIGGGEGGHGGTITITGGNITVEGGTDAAAIGGGEGGDSGDITISGGNITATTLDYGSAIGAGEDGKVNSIKLLGGTITAKGGDNGWAVGSEEEPESGTITIGDNMKVTSERTFTSAERVAGCRWRKSVTIEPCNHTPQNGDAADIANTYDINDNQFHTKHCRYCDETVKEEHSGEDCVCGQKSISTFYLYMPGTEKNSYEMGATITVGLGKEYYLPRCLTVPEGYAFMGWEMNPDPENVGGWAAVLGGDGSNDINMPAGTSVKTVPGLESAKFYARYLYVFEDTWTWSDDASSASLTLSHADLGNVTLNSTDSNPKVTIQSSDLYEYIETEGEDGTMVLEPVKTGTRYTATVKYNVNGYDYTFKDSKEIMLPLPEETMQELVLNDDADNTETLTANDGKKANVTLSGRTLRKDGSWNTLCLPFDVDDLKGTPLEGAIVKTLASSDFDSSTGTLTLNFSDSRHALSAGTPYIVKWKTTSQNITDPVFNDVVIEATACTIGTMYVDFVGAFSPLVLEQESLPALCLGGNNMLYYPNKDMNVNACRAYFQLGNALPGSKTGDVNDDGYVNVTDVTLVVDHILGKSDDNFIIENADINSDGTISVADVTALVDLILGGNSIVKVVINGADGLTFSGFGSDPARVPRK